jgi:catechol 2,3-dioxygenase-like lactoylglutathione lyase family enzyme
MLKWPAWIGVVCDDLETQRCFYRDVLGMKEVRSGPSYVWFELDGRLFELLAKSELPQYDRRRVSLGYEVDDIDVAAAELRKRGVVPLSEVQGGPEVGQCWAYFKDAEENVFEVIQRFR